MKSKYDNNWQPIATAPKDGRIIEINYGTSEAPEDICLAFWSERPVCMGGPMIYNKPGWATAGPGVDSNLPLDPPNFWRDEPHIPIAVTGEEDLWKEMLHKGYVNGWNIKELAQEFSLIRKP